MVFQLEQQRYHTLTKKLVALECGRLDETALIYPETELWASIVEALCNRLQQGCSLDKLVPVETTKEGVPFSSAERSLALLEALRIDASEQEIVGGGSVADRTAFLERLVGIAEGLDTANRGDRLRSAVQKDASLLATGCGAIPELQGECARLFRRYPELHQALQNERVDVAQPLAAKLEEIVSLTQQKEKELEALGGKQAKVDTEELSTACSTLEHAFGAYVAGVAEFEALFTQDIRPWTSSSGLPDVEGVGPLASDVAAAYSRLREVVGACSTLRGGYEKLVNSHQGSAGPEGEPLAKLTQQGPILARQLGERAAALRHLATNGLPVGPAATACL